MTPPPRIDILRVSGATHREVGRQLGELARDRLHAEAAGVIEDLPAGRTLERQRELAKEWRAFAEPRLPWLVDELDGIAEAAGLDAELFFAASIEELWYEPAEVRRRAATWWPGPSATVDGHLLVGHTNDLRPSAEEHIVGIEKRVDGDPTIFQLGGVPWLSVGWNSAGLSLTGNELSPNDERLGISRSHQVLEMMRARSLGEMVVDVAAPGPGVELQQRAHELRRRRRQRRGKRDRRRGDGAGRRRTTSCTRTTTCAIAWCRTRATRRTRCDRRCGTRGRAS